MAEVAGFSELYERLRRSFSITGKAESTLNNYARCLAQMALHAKQSPEKLDAEAVQDYLYLCKEQHATPSDSFFKHTVYGLRAAYKVMGLPTKKVALPQIKRQDKLPVVLSRREVKELLHAPKYLRHKLMLGFLYSCGLRSYELCNLRLADLDFDRKTVFVQKQKGRVDRYLPLSKHLSRGLKIYISEAQPIEYVFESQVHDASGGVRKLTTRALQWLLKECRGKITTHKKITSHSLRHTYATHLLEDGVDILTLKKLLGHARIETTLLYLHVAQLPSTSNSNPLDNLYDDAR